MKKSKKKDKFDNKYFTRKLEMQVIQPGDGRNFPCKGNIVTVHYTANVYIILFFLNNFLV